MKPESKRDPIKKYYFGCIVATAIYFAIVFTILFFKSGILSVLAIATLFYPYKLAVRTIANKTLLPVLYVDFDAKEFQKVVNSLLNKRNYNARIDYRMLIAISTGDYQDAINVATNQLNSKRCPISGKYYFLYHLAYVYFEIRDFEKLRLVLNKYDEYNEINRSKCSKRIAELFDFYKAFLDSNYDECKVLCKTRISSLNVKSSTARYRKIHNIFYYAVASYYNRETELAKKNFEVVLNATQKLNISSIAKEYLEAIENNAEISAYDEILPEDDFELHTKENKRRLRINKIIIIIWCSLLISYIVGTSIIDYRNKKENEQKHITYEHKLNDAISKNYTKAELLEYFDLKYNGEYIDPLCIIDTGRRLDIASIVTYDKGETSDLLTFQKNVKIGKYYCEKLPVTNYYVGFKIYDEEKNADDVYYVVEFTYDDTKYWLVIDYIGETPKE